MTTYFRPLVRHEPVRPSGAVPIAGGSLWFDNAVEVARGTPPQVVPADALPKTWIDAISAPRPAIAGLSGSGCHVMGILNVTPDSFSDGGQFQDTAAVAETACTMLAAGAALLDVGGESTRPGAETIPPEIEIQRTEPVIAALSETGLGPISIDTRKAAVAQAAAAAGAHLINDVSGLLYDPDMVSVCKSTGLPVCVMHAQGTPETMQDDPRYDDVVLDVYDWLQDRITTLEAQGIPRDRIIADPGIGFGKTLAHNLRLLEALPMFHGLGVTLMLGASRKGFIGKIAGVTEARDRMPGSVAAAIAGAAAGVQVLRVHDVAATCQALRVWQAINGGGANVA